MFPFVDGAARVCDNAVMMKTLVEIELCGRHLSCTRIKCVDFKARWMISGFKRLRLPLLLSCEHEEKEGRGLLLADEI